MIKRFLSLVLVLTFLLSSVVPMNVIAQESNTNNKGTESLQSVSESAYGKRIIVKYKDGTKSETIKKHVKDKLKISIINTKNKFKNSNIELIELGDNDNINNTISELKNNPDVEFVQEDYPVWLASIPNDTKFSEQWALKNIGQSINGTIGMAGVDTSVVNAWDITTGENKVIIAVIDTGLDISHEDLLQNIWINTSEIAGDRIDNDNNGYIDDINGYNFADNSSNIFDTSSSEKHATHLAGIIAATQNNSKGISGIVQNVKIMPLKIVKNGVGYTSDAIAAIEYAEASGASIVNCS